MVTEFENIINFLTELDAEIKVQKPIELFLIGGGGVTLVYDHSNRTVDLDFIDPPEIIVIKGGQGSSLALKYGIYVSSVYEINFTVPSDWRQHAKPINQKFKNFVIYVASAEDIVLGKIARLELKDFDDIYSMKDLGYLDEDKILKRLNENLHEIKTQEYRNNVVLFFRDVFDKKAIIEKGKVKLV
ncbi:hypothetical protein K1X76_07965 [bacterium]|nr:hypothetical protein [bacterium]